jgi:hypothetical protein
VLTWRAQDSSLPPLRLGEYSFPFRELLVPARISHTVFLDQWQRYATHTYIHKKKKKNST